MECMEGMYGGIGEIDTTLVEVHAPLEQRNKRS